MHGSRPPLPEPDEYRIASWCYDRDRQFPPLPPGQVDVAEVIGVLRRIATARPQVVFPANGWKHLWRGVGEFTIDGWSIEAFKRDFGMKYVQEARAPVGRTGDYKSFAARAKATLQPARRRRAGRHLRNPGKALGIWEVV